MTHTSLLCSRSADDAVGSNEDAMNTSQIFGFSASAGRRSMANIVPAGRAIPLALNHSDRLRSILALSLGLVMTVRSPAVKTAVVGGTGALSGVGAD